MNYYTHIYIREDWTALIKTLWSCNENNVELFFSRSCTGCIAYSADLVAFFLIFYLLVTEKDQNNKFRLFCFSAKITQWWTSLVLLFFSSSTGERCDSLSSTIKTEWVRYYGTDNWLFGTFRTYTRNNLDEFNYAPIWHTYTCQIINSYLYTKKNLIWTLCGGFLLLLVA